NAQNSARLRFDHYLHRPATHLAIRSEALRGDTRINDQFKTLAAIRTFHVFRHFHAELSPAKGPPEQGKVQKGIGPPYNEIPNYCHSILFMDPPLSLLRTHRAHESWTAAGLHKQLPTILA